ncbi:SAM-dependent chlorinase/fluorinase, partial [Candidatus Aerophobetes bacterium]|nr:SAM-dependent chlorinase/fluorinase [Candidatus Aerophobetes bacterium]
MGQMKGVILSINEEVEIVDITHQVENYNLVEGAFLISQVCPFFPEGTIHLAVIDPGVGTSRKGLIIQTDKYYFV